MRGRLRLLSQHISMDCRGEEDAAEDLQRDSGAYRKGVPNRERHDLRAMPFLNEI